MEPSQVPKMKPIQDCFGRNQDSQYRTLFQEQRHLKFEFKYH